MMYRLFFLGVWVQLKENIIVLLGNFEKSAPLSLKSINLASFLVNKTN